MALIYKYYGFDAGLAALRGGTLGFRQPTDLNDPMEFQLWLHRNSLDPCWLKPLMENVGVLSMTRNPLNPVMWSHYGDEHRGFVIGYALEDPIFGPEIDTIISAGGGEVSYSEEYFEVENPNDAGLEASQWVNLGEDAPLSDEAMRALKNIFLVKHPSWAYEEEVRIVKLLWNIGEETHAWIKKTGHNWEIKSDSIAPMTLKRKVPGLYLTKGLDASIKEVVLGVRNPLLSDQGELRTESALDKKCSEFGWQIKRIDWEKSGDLSLSEAGVNVAWGTPKKISSKSLSFEEAQAIRETTDQRANDKNGITVTSWSDGSVSAYYDDEL